MMKNILHVILVNLLIYNITLAQSVTVLPGETSYDYSYVYSGDKNFAKNFCVYNKGKGMITIGFEVLNATSPNALYWDTTKIAFHYNGAWHSIGDFIAKTGSAPTNLKTSYSASNYYTTSYGTLSNGETHVTEAYAVGGGTHDIDVYLKNYNNLKVYDTTYLPIVSKANRLAPADNVNFSFQTQRYSSTYPSPVKNPSSSSGVSAVLEANDIPDQTYYSNLPGVYSTEIGTQRIIVVNITNLPPEMISSSGFRVHMYQHQVNAAFNDDRIFEWVYNNQNFMTNGPSSLSASTNSCSGVVLNWSNSQNSTPADGVTMVKTVILRDGAFLAMVNEGVNTYTDATALINTDYNYKVLHVAFSEFGDTYYKSPESSTVTGHKKPSPDEPISLTATNNNCASKVTLNWSYNGANPASFYVATADSATATTWTTLAGSLSGSARSYEHTSVTRGKEYFYRVYSINSCGDSSLTYASTSGISPNDPTSPTVVGTTVDAINGTITFKWKDNANNETKYEVIRQDDGGNTVYFDVNAQTGTGDTLSYVDNGVSPCTAYTYKAKAYNDCVLSGVSSTTGSTNQLPPPNLTNTFASPNFFKGSKGYYVNRVELQWTNNNNTVLDLIKIYRKELGSTNPAAQITSVTPGTELYVDNTADAGVFYEYSLVGVSYCLGATYYTDTIKDIGFRSATGIVNGHIEYSGGVAVKGVKVNLESANGTSGKSLKTSTGNYGAIPNSSDFAFANNFTFETYVKIPATTNNINIIQKSGAFGLTYSSSNQIQFLVNTGTATTLNVNSTIDDGTYHHLAGVYDGTYIKLYLDGLLTDSVAKTGNITTNTNNILLGNLTADTLFLDEVRFYNVAKTKQQISQDYSRVLRGNENGLIAYYRFNEGEGTAFYDISYHSGTVYNENHGYFIGAPKFTNSIPLAAQLSFAGYTNTNGDYTVNVAYNGIGEIFTATPQYLTHQFSPGSQSLFIGDNSQIQNGIDFTDISSFTVTGNVKYKDGSCPEEGVFLKIDGNVVIVNGMPVTTDASGNFNIQVPIGNHFISVDRNQHIFSDGRWPITGTYDFQAPVSGLQFIDSTYVKVIGRVVGGTKESSKPMIPGRSNNNIGQATIQFNTLDGCNTNSLTTNSVSGDYEVFLHPLKYTIPDFSTTNTSSPNFSTFSAAVFSNNQILDLSTIPPVQTIIDTLFTSADHSTWSSVDSVDYQVIRSWTYRNSPEIWITDTTWINYAETTAGDGELYYTDPVTDDKDTIVLPTKNALGFPIYHERRDYYVNIGVMEVYKDLALSTTDSVPVTSGNLLINNALAKTPVIAVSLSDTAVFKSWNKDTCYYRYHFVGGNPSIGYTAGDASNFSKQFTVQYAGGANTANWLPGGSVFKGIIIGGMSSDGQSFVTLGPEVPTMILRDPPGSASFSSLESGSTIVNTSSWSVAENLGASMAATIELGTEFTTGIGMEVETDVENSLTLGAEIESTITQAGNFSEAITLTEGWSTSPSTDFVGSDGDIYIGKSMNITFGMSRNIMLLKDSECSLSGIECRTEIITVAGEDYRIGKKSSLSAAPGGYATSFIYSQDHIINKLIPRLEQLRNQLFVDKPNLYVSYLPSSDPNFGKNNDDPVFGTSVSTPDPLKSELPDTNGVSYRYIVPSSPITVPVKSALTGAVTYETLPPLSGDSVRWYNQQIRLWEEAIRINEQEKYEALMDGTQLIQNYSFSSGIEYQNSATTESTEALEFTFEVGVSANMAIEIGGSVGGVGVGLEMGLSLGLTSGGGFGTENTSSTTFAFTFLDEDVGDFYSVDVRKSKLGYGPIFNIVAGETSCPWEGPDESIYYTSANQPVTLSSGTLHRELVEMKVDGSPTYSQKINVPSNSSATFNLELTNITETNDDYDYGIKVLAETNPNGAILSIDGYSPSTQAYPVAAGSSLNKTLVLQRGSVEYDYDSIAVVVYSLCGDEVVGDTVYVTAHFLPSCSDVTVQYPLNQWVVNNSFNDTLPVIIGGYDINFNGLEEIGLEIKPSSQSSWIGLQNWYKYVATPGPDSLQISQSNANTFYSWILQGIPDGQYDIRVKSSCVLADNQSNVFTGIIDRINPHPFGTPSPADGILDPNDDIYIQMNEPVDIGAMNSYNFDVRGVLNGSDIRHSESLNFDGTSSFARVSGGANLRQRSFTVEFWAKLNTTGIDQTVFSQGTNAAQSMAIGFNSSDEFTFRLGNQTVTSTVGIGTLTDWQHYAVVYDYTNNAAMLYVDGNLVNNGNLNLFFDYQGDGKLAFGKELPANTNFFNGNLHEMRLWNDVRSVSEIVQNLAIELAGNESGLLYNWRMNEIVGAVAEDHVRARNADLFGTTWEVNPNGFAAQFDGMDDYFAINSSTIPITKEMDFTLEFWFRSSQSGVATLFSNGNGDGLQADSLTSWNITKDASGIIHIYHNGLDFVATTQDHFDGNWHHFALVMNRNANLSSYIDGNLEGSAQAINFEQMGSPEMFLGAHGFYIGGSFSVQDFFQGDMDEFRFWNTSRKLEQIRRDLRNSMLGNEYGLEAYLPFEDYQLVLGAPIITSSTSDQSENANTITNNGSVTIISQTPTLKLPRPVEAVPFTFSVNNDKIIITPTASSELIEKVTLDITVKNVKDLHGNIMQSPKTWIAYVNKNQVLWQDDEFTFTKTEDEVVTFSTYIVNTGGAAKMFTVGGLPSWMTASLTSGTISPNSSQQITFTIHDGYSVGEYFADVTLTTDFGYDEVLRVNLSVVGTPPNWTVNPANYAYNMAIFGELEIDGIINTNTNSMLGAFIDDSICGVANLQYLPAYDRYEVFLNVYSNNITGDSIRFKIYDATTGFIFVDVTPSILFMENDIQGTVANPITFRASTTIALNIPLNKGWTWFSMPLETNDLSSSTLLTEDLVNTTNDLIKGQVSFDQYASSMGWLGGITAGGGYLNAESYKYFRANRDTLELIGKRIHPDSSIAQINLDQGWNWMGYVSTKVSSLTTALGQLTPTDGDIIKSQYNFAVYDNLNGWIGSLTQMKPGYGYMYKAINATSFNYPISLYYGKSGSYTADDSFNLPQEYTFEAGDYSKTMSVIGISNLCPEAQTDENIILVAYDMNHNVRGWVQGQTIDNEIMFFITVHGNTANEEIYFEYINVLTRQSVPAMGVGLLFQNDQLIGTMSNPMDVVVSEEEVCKLLTPTNVTEMADLGFSTYPNPFNNEISIEFETLVAVNISLRDVLGRIIVNENYTGQGKHTIRIIETLPAGVYTLSLTGDIETNLKLIKN